MFNDVNFSCSFSNDSQICMPRKAYKWTMIFLKIIILSFPGQRAVANWYCVSFLKGSSGDNSSHPSMEYGQFPFPSTSVPQDNLFQDRSHSQSKQNLWWSVITTPFSFPCKAKFIIVIIITIIVFPIIIMVRFQRHKLCSVCVLWLSLYLLKKCCKTLRNLSKREHIKLFAMGPVLMWFVIWHNKESRGHNMETNQVQMTTTLQFHVTFTLPSITLRLHAMAVIGQQRPVTLLSYSLMS